MKKIGILSQFYRRNYGGILQSYALFRAVQDLGYDVEIIDFRFDTKSNFTISQIATILKNKIFKKFSRKQADKKTKIAVRELPMQHVEAFMKFKEKYQILSPALNNNTIGDYVCKYDAIIVGSDQVWNDVEGRHLFYFFDFGKPYNGRKITYAPCSIIEKINGKTKKRLNELLLDIDCLSVRDVTTQRFVEMSTGVSPNIVLDPTFLYGFQEFTTPPLVDGDYIFAYILGSEISCGHNMVLEKVYEKYGRMKVIAAIIPDDSLEVEKFADEVKYNASPADWVNLIANAKFVYTDSFHGCVFSMKFHKQFFAYYKDFKRASRLLALKNSYMLPNICSSVESIQINNVNYEIVDSIIEKERSASFTFLKDSLPT